MPVRLRDALATTEPLADLFSDASVLQAMLDFEGALARVEARLGLIPQKAAEAIAHAARAQNFDTAALAAGGLRAGTLAIPLVKALTERVRAADADAAGYVHWGATSQDVTDTALVILLGRVRSIFAADHARIEQALRGLSEKHAATVMLGRTLLQPAPPTTFGLKAAGWLAALDRGWKRVDGRFEEARLLQFGGASGTLASLGDKGIAAGEALATELGLTYPAAPWHSHRDCLAALLCAMGVYTGSLAKMAGDVALLMQQEVAEAFEPGGDGRGGSSTMPHKRNPTACSLALSCANRVPGLVANFLSGMPHEHERAAGAWHAEWSTITAIVEATGLALASMVEVAEGLTVDAARMRANIEATHGLIFTERAMMILAEKIGRDAAHHQMTEAARKGEIPRVTQDIDTPEAYLGSAEAFRKRLLDAAKKQST